MLVQRSVMGLDLRGPNVCDLRLILQSNVPHAHLDGDSAHTHADRTEII